MYGKTRNMYTKYTTLPNMVKHTVLLYSNLCHNEGGTQEVKPGLILVLH